MGAPHPMTEREMPSNTVSKQWPAMFLNMFGATEEKIYVLLQFPTPPLVTSRRQVENEHAPVPDTPLE
jgi:hypothetical protein